MFALRQPPPERIEIGGGGEYRLVRVFKHDFWAATCLYEGLGPQESVSEIVVKFGRSQPFCGLPLQFYARMLADHEEAIYNALKGIEGVPRWVGRVEGGYAMEYIHSQPLDHLDKPPAGFFQRLRKLFDEIHARGVAYCDANKRSNILVDRQGQPFLIDYQISLLRRQDWPGPLGKLSCKVIDYLQTKDLYHLYKHKRRMAPEELTEEEEALSRRRTGLHLLHRKLSKPYRALRRRFLAKQYAKGALQSPTADLEDHYQPEKETWKEGRHSP